MSFQWHQILVYSHQSRCPTCLWHDVFVARVVVHRLIQTCLSTYAITNSWNRVLQKLIAPQLVKKFPSHCGTQNFITAFMSPFVPVLNQTNPFQALQSYFVNTHFNIILPSTPRSSSWSLSVRFPGRTPAGISLYPITYIYIYIYIYGPLRHVLVPWADKPPFF
jgi:hypothetical protein